MTDAVVPALIPYARFLECLEQRSSIRLELARQDAQRTGVQPALPAAPANDGRAPVLAVRTDSAAGVDNP